MNVDANQQINKCAPLVVTICIATKAQLFPIYRTIIISDRGKTGYEEPSANYEIRS